MANETLLQALAHGAIGDRTQIVFAWHHPENPRNTLPSHLKRHNTTGHLSDEFPNRRGMMQIRHLAGFLLHIARTGSLPPARPQPRPTASHKIAPEGVAEVIAHTPGTPRCYLATRTLSRLVHTALENTGIVVATGEYSSYQGLDYGLRGPNMGALNGLTSTEIGQRFPELALAHSGWEAANRQPQLWHPGAKHPFPPDYPQGSRIADWLQRYEQAVGSALRLRLAPSIGQGAIIRVFAGTTSSTRALATIMDAPHFGNIDDSGRLRRLDAPISYPGDIAGWVLYQGKPPTPITDSFVQVPDTQLSYATGRGVFV